VRGKERIRQPRAIFATPLLPVAEALSGPTAPQFAAVPSAAGKIEKSKTETANIEPLYVAKEKGTRVSVPRKFSYLPSPAA